MKRLLVVFALVLATLLPAAASAQLPTFQLSQELLDFMAGAPPADDLAVGEGKHARTEKGESVQFTVSAHGPGGPGAQPGRGNARINIDGVQAHGTVECLAVSGRIAFIDGTFDEPVEFAGQTYPDFVMTLIDNGEPNEDTPDQANIFLDSNPNPCIATLFVLADGLIEQGNIVVMDRP